MNEAIELLKDNVDVDDQGDIADYLSGHVTWHDDETLELTQPHLIQFILDDLNLTDESKRASTPAPSTIILNANLNGQDHDDHFNYRSVIGNWTVLKSQLAPTSAMLYINAHVLFPTLRNHIHPQSNALDATSLQRKTKVTQWSRKGISALNAMLMHRSQANGTSLTLNKRALIPILLAHALATLYVTLVSLSHGVASSKQRLPSVPQRQKWLHCLRQLGRTYTCYDFLLTPRTTTWTSTSQIQRSTALSLKTIKERLR